MIVSVSICVSTIGLPRTTVGDVLSNRQVWKKIPFLKDISEMAFFRWEALLLLGGIQYLIGKQEISFVRVQNAADAVEQCALTTSRRSQKRRYLLRDGVVNLKLEIAKSLAKIEF